MKPISFATLFLLLLTTLSILSACHNSNGTTTTVEVKPDTMVKTIVHKEEIPVPKKAPIINITDTVSVKQMVIVMKDSAATSNGIATKLALIYGVKLAAIIKTNKLKVTGQPMAWYKTQKPPFFFEAGIPVDKKPAKLPLGASLKQIGTDSITVAHFYGPYDLTGQAYTAVQDMLKDRKKKTTQAPYEIYVDDPMDKSGKLKDPYKVQTDIIYTWR